MITCAACGRLLSNDSAKTNYASWTYVSEDGGNRLPYCSDSLECALTAYQQVRERLPS